MQWSGFLQTGSDQVMQDSNKTFGSSIHRKQAPADLSFQIENNELSTENW